VNNFYNSFKQEPALLIKQKYIDFLLFLARIVGVFGAGQFPIVSLT
jgi:hypothetical protein